MNAAGILVVVAAVAALGGLGWFFFGPRKATAAVLAGGVRRYHPASLPPAGSGFRADAEPRVETSAGCAAYDAEPGRQMREKVPHGGMS